MFKSNSKKFAAILMTAVMLASLQTSVFAAVPTDASEIPVSVVNTNPSAFTLFGDTAAGQGQTAARAPGGFTPSAQAPHAEFVRSIRNHAAAVNTETVGWLIIPNTNINFPVVLNATGNSHYLYRDVRGNDYTGRLDWRNWAQFPDTATFLDFRTRLGDTWAGTSRNIVLYNHNWTNLRAPFRIGNHQGERMFAQLKSYKSIQFATQNPHIYFSTPEMEGIWRVFAVGYAHTTPAFFYNNPNMTRACLETMIYEWRHRSHIHFNVPVDADDRIMTLSTCTRHHGSTETQRYVVVARLLRAGESENDVVTATANPNIRHPDFSLPTRLPAQPPAQPAQPAQQAQPAQSAAAETNALGVAIEGAASGLVILN